MNYNIHARNKIIIKVVDLLETSDPHPIKKLVSVPTCRLWSHIQSDNKLKEMLQGRKRTYKLVWAKKYINWYIYKYDKTTSHTFCTKRKILSNIPKINEEF